MHATMFGQRIPREGGSGDTKMPATSTIERLVNDYKQLLISFSIYFQKKKGRKVFIMLTGNEVVFNANMERVLECE